MMIENKRQPDGVRKDAAAPRAWSRRRFLAAFLSLAAYLKLARPGMAANEDYLVLKGRWLLKRSDLP